MQIANLARFRVQVRAHCQRMLHLKGSSFEDLAKTLDGTAAGERKGVICLHVP